MEHIIDISRRGQADDMIPAWLTIESGLDARSALEAFRKAISHFLALSEDGQGLWKETCGDFNYGDILMNEECIRKSLHFQSALRGKIKSWKIDRGEIGMNLGTYYDDVIYPLDV